VLAVAAPEIGAVLVVFEFLWLIFPNYSVQRMDSTVSAFCFVVALLSITAVVTKIARKSIASDVMSRKPLPPVVNILTILRLLPTIFTTELPAIIDSLHEKFGSVFTISLFGPKVTFLVGPEVSQHFFQGMKSEISHGNLLEFTVPMFGKHVGYSVDAATRKEQYRFYMDALAKRKCQSSGTVTYRSWIDHPKPS
jgi:sterol 14-demethylase